MPPLARHRAEGFIGIVVVAFFKCYERIAAADIETGRDRSQLNRFGKASWIQSMLPEVRWATCKHLGRPEMQFGEKVRELRKTKSLSQRDLAAQVGVNFTYISKIENEKLDFGDYPSEELIGKLAAALDGDEDELLILANKIPERIRKRVMERPDAFLVFAGLDDKTIDSFLSQLPAGKAGKKPK